MKPEHSFSVGYARVDITPTESVPLAGYGNTLQRLSQGVLDPLYATCIAITDNSGSTVLLCTVDLINSLKLYSDPARDAISKQYGIDRDAVVFSAIHTHSAPDLAQSTYEPIIRYTAQLVEKLTVLAGAALADRKLDIAHQLELMDMLRKLADGGKGVVTVMHDLPLAFTFSDRILLINEGEVVCDGLPEKVCEENAVKQIFGIALNRSEDGRSYRYQY